jgi:hypothetical protein
LIAENGLKPEYFLAKRGDVLIWHANLLHGGSPRQNTLRTRKALVCHFFAKGCVCYHDYSGSLSYLHRYKMRLADFDREAYLAANPDVREAGVDAWEHYLAFGYDEERSTAPDQAVPEEPTAPKISGAGKTHSRTSGRKRASGSVRKQSKGR